MFDLLARLGLTTPRVGGIMPFSTVRTALMTADSPLAASLWPMFVLTFSLLRSLSYACFGDSTYCAYQKRLLSW